MSAGARSRQLFERAEAVIPGGVNSPVRSFAAVGGDPRFIASGSGAQLLDVDGRRFIDYVQSWGASILGHAHPAVTRALELATPLGTTFGAPTEHEVLLAEAITSSVPGAAMVRLVSSGTEAAMTAVRLARGATGRARIVQFAGCYHGHSDGLLAAGGSGVATLGLAGSAGVPPGAVADTLVVPYNTVPDLDEQVAAVIVEPVAANMGLVPPAPGFLQGLREACDEVGALLIFDEVITGFRLGRSGAAGRFGVTADLTCLGKVIGGGLPLAALAGRREVMQRLAPLGPVYQAGTLSGNPLATAAGLAVLQLLDESSYLGLEATVARLVSGLAACFDEAGVAVQLPVLGTLFSIFFTDTAVQNYAQAQAAASGESYREFFQAMLAEGVALAPSPYEVAFTSLAHDEATIEATLEAASAAARSLSH